MAFAGCVLYGVVLVAVYVIHARWLPVGVVFYAAILDAVLALLVTGGLLLACPRVGVLDVVDRLLLALVLLLAGYAFAISVPTVLDRSLSFYLLEKIEERGGRVPVARFEYIFTHEYIRDHQLVAIRLTEQEASGTVRVRNGCVELTERGRRLAGFSRFFRRELLARHRLLMGQSSAELTLAFPPGSRIAADTCAGIP
jgi:hypothetical protein